MVYRNMFLDRETLSKSEWVISSEQPLLVTVCVLTALKSRPSRQRRLISSASFIFQPDESLIFDGV